MYINLLQIIKNPFQVHRFTLPNPTYIVFRHFSPIQHSKLLHFSTFSKRQYTKKEIPCILKYSWLCNDVGVLQYVQTELPTFLRGINLGLSWRGQELKILYQTSQSNAKNWQCKNNSRAASSSNTKGKVPEVIAIGLNLRLLFQEPFWPEHFWVFPVGWVVS